MAKTLVPPVKSMDLNLNVKMCHAIINEDDTNDQSLSLRKGGSTIEC